MPVSSTPDLGKPATANPINPQWVRAHPMAVEDISAAVAVVLSAAVPLEPSTLKAHAAWTKNKHCPHRSASLVNAFIQDYPQQTFLTSTATGWLCTRELASANGG